MGPPTFLPSTNSGHDAVRADGVAAHRNLNPGLEGALAVLRERGGEGAVVEAEAAARDTHSPRAEPVAEVGDRTRPEGDVNAGVQLEDALALRFCVAPADG